MHRDVKNLADMQKIVARLEEIDQLLQNLPADLQPIHDDFHRLQGERKTWQERTEELKKLRKEKEWSLDEWKGKREKLKKQSSHIASQKDYSAYVKARDEIDQHIQELEDEILNIMEEQEDLEKKLHSTEEEFRTLEETYRKGMEKWEEDKKVWQEEKENLLRDKAIIEKEIPGDLLQHFWHLYEKRNGVAVVPIVDRACGGCHVTLRPQQYVEVRAGRSIQRCDACNRFLYYEGE